MTTRRRLAALAAALVLLWLGLRYLLPLLLPFLLGAGLALAAEPLVRLCADRLHLPRGAAAFLGVTAALALLGGVITLLGSFLVRELGVLAGALPDLESAFTQGASVLEEFLLSLAGRSAESVRPLLTRSVLSLFQGGAAIFDRVVQRFPGLLTGILSHVPESALALGTGVLSAFMISARLPALRDLWANRVPEEWKRRYVPALTRVRTGVTGWLKAQVKLSAMTFGLVLGGLLLLRVSHAPIWAAGVALVDALPVFGAGTVLLPWCLVCLIQGDTVLAIGLGAIYAAAALTRTTMEPRLVGKQLGVDPLLTLVALYAGFRLWGILGMFVSPLLAMAVVQAVKQE